MTIFEGLEGLTKLPPGAAVSIGNFDGIHRGHRSILEEARRLRDGSPEAGAPPASATAVVTFEPHPLTVLRPEKAPPRLTPPRLKHRLLESLGVDALVTLAPTPPVLDLTAEQFWQVLRDQARPAHLVEGPGFSFGKGRAGTIDRLRTWCAADGVRLHVIEPVAVPLLDLHVAPISSSLVRWLLAHGRVRDAAICLGRGYELEGEVVRGHQRGRAIGVPTANLRCNDQMIPADGVYVGRCRLDGATYPAAVSIGTAPTFGANQRQVEAHLIGFSGDLYGRELAVEMIDWGRDQWKFPDLQALKSRIHRDLAEVAARSATDPSRWMGV